MNDDDDIDKNRRRSSRLNPKQNLKRDYSGRFKGKCGSMVHDSANDDSPKIDLKKRKRITKAAYDNLLRKNIINDSTTSICEECLNQTSMKAIKSDNIEKHDSNECEETLESENEDDDSLLVKAFDIGNEIKDAIRSDVLSLFRQGSKNNVNDIKDLLNHGANKWLSERPPELINLVSNYAT